MLHRGDTQVPVCLREGLTSFSVISMVPLVPTPKAPGTLKMNGKWEGRPVSRGLSTPPAMYVSPQAQVGMSNWSFYSP